MYLLVALSFVIGITIGSSHVVAQQTSIPNWVKHTALWWGQGQVGDADFIKAIQWMVDNGLIHISNTTPSQGQQSQILQSQSTQNNTIFSPCATVNLTAPSNCLAYYLPAPTDIGPQWSSHNGIGIPNGINTPVLTQMVREDFENTNTNQIEIFDVWIEEYQPPEKGHAVFKLDEQTMENGATKFIGSAKSNDTSFICICPDGAGGTSYNSEFVVDSVVVKVDGIGNAKTVITDMGTINKIIVSKIIQNP